MGSTRLPGKVLKLFDEDKTILDVLIGRLKICKLVDEIIIATTPKKKNTYLEFKEKIEKFMKNPSYYNKY